MFENIKKKKKSQHMSGDAGKRTVVFETTTFAIQSFCLRNVFSFSVCFLLLLQTLNVVSLKYDKY